MKFTELQKKRLQLNLQMFTDGAGEAGTGAADVVEGGDGTEVNPTPPQSITLTPEELTAQINQAVATAVQAQQTEAQRLAAMSDDERRQHQDQQRENTLQQREQEIARKELRIEAIGQLAQEELPAELIDLVALDSAEACNASIKAIKASFNKAVDDAVQRRLVKSAYVPGASGSGNQGNTKGSMGERLAKQKEDAAQKKSNFFKN